MCNYRRAYDFVREEPPGPQRMATTTTAVHRTFVATPLADTVLTDLPGIGDVGQRKLRDANINNPKNLMGQYLVQAD